MSNTQGWLFTLMMGFVTAQRFPMGFSYDTDIPSLTQPCRDALNSTVDCSWQLALYNTEDIELTTSNLTRLCTSSCYNSLLHSRGIIQSACSAKSNEIAVDGDMYPATQRIDSLIDTYSKTCLKDQGTHRFCHDVMGSWQNLTKLTSEQNCSYCMLKTRQLGLSSDFSYNPHASKEFASLTSSCGKTGFEPTIPTSIVTSRSSTAAAPSVTPSCAATYTIKADDTCNSICKAHGVSTDSLTMLNGLPAYCKHFPSAGTKLCMPPKCAIYTVAANDTCQSVANQQPGYVTITQLQSWNPNLNGLCTNMGHQVDMQICVSPPGEDILSPTTTIPAAETATVRGSTGPCTGPGSPESCYSDWASLSPTPFGSHATYTSQSAESTGFTPAFTPNPTAPGTASRASCDQYISYLDTGDESLDKTINTCGGIAKLYGTTAEKLKEWNPSLRSSQPCLLKTGLSYCVVVKDASAD